jgi:6-phosphogluconolactonase/glucosamine-6-phosphate isomerase/deaminase
MVAMGMEIRKESKEQGAEHLRSVLNEQLEAGKCVLWLVSGGSNVTLECGIAAELADVSNLQAALVDERYGLPGHQDSNYQKLVDGGFTVALAPVLEAGLDIKETTHRYNERLEVLLDAADVVVAQLGIGADGHTNGVLPHSSVVGSKKLLEQYEGPDFQRITMTLEALRFADVVFVFAYGEDKQATLTRLRDEDIPFDDQPSQILKQLPQVYLYNDSIEGGQT